MRATLGSCRLRWPRVDESWTTHSEDWVIVGSGLPASQLVQSTTRQSVRSLAVQPDSLSLVLEATALRHTGQKTVGYATRGGASC